jgi:hypothetical protein
MLRREIREWDKDFMSVTMMVVLFQAGRSTGTYMAACVFILVKYQDKFLTSRLVADAFRIGKLEKHVREGSFGIGPAIAVARLLLVFLISKQELDSISWIH